MTYIYQPFRDRLERQIAQAAPHVKGRVLDVGAGGFDRYSKLFNTEKYVRMDIPGTPHVDIEAYAESIPLEDASFDAIVCTQVLEVTNDPKKALAEFHRALKPDGTVLLTTGFLAPISGDKTDAWRFTDYGLRKLFTEAGFSIVKIEPIGGLWGVLLQFVERRAITKFDIYTKPYRRLFSRAVHFLAKIADRLDAKGDHLFAHGFLVVATK